MENTKLKIGDKFIINEEEYFGVNKGRYVITNIYKDRRGGMRYEFKCDRKNAVTKFNLYVDIVDNDLKIPTIEDITTNAGLVFLNFSSIIKYDEEMINSYKESLKELEKAEKEVAID